jgi:hypothetical protein
MKHSIPYMHPNFILGVCIFAGIIYHTLIYAYKAVKHVLFNPPSDFCNVRDIFVQVLHHTCKYLHVHYVMVRNIHWSCYEYAHYSLELSNWLQVTYGMYILVLHDIWMQNFDFWLNWEHSLLCCIGAVEQMLHSYINLYH